VVVEAVEAVVIDMALAEALQPIGATWGCK
jgi:hypothetical protein